MSSKNNIIKYALSGMLIIGAIMTSFFLGCGRENKLVDVIKEGNTQLVSIPKIDAVIPARIETATFALG